MAAVKVSHGASKDMVAAAGKADALKAQYEEETNKFEACQVSFIILVICLAESICSL